MGSARFRTDGTVSATPQITPGNTTTDITSGVAGIGLAMTAVTPSLPAGSHTFALACQDATGDMESDNTTISAMLAG